MVAPAMATAHNKQMNIRMANLTEFPYTIENHTKVPELQILKPNNTKQMRPIAAAALKILQEPDDTHIYVNELMKSSEMTKTKKVSGFPHRKIQALGRNIRQYNNEY